ncbi:MAG: Rne/Rng family ribonuclease [Woeseiaceae bacterium]|nr:Rne/Rng family ribonuclease [Woeseiaceae bacterium]
MKRMLINATQEEELRMAMVDGQLLYDLNIEAPARERKKANIYKGKITRIEPSLEAAFVDYGADRHGFLPLKEISSEYFVKDTKSGDRANIRDVLREGQDIVVQVDKEERGNKGAALTTFVSLAGRFIVLKPNKDRSGGVSRRIVGDDRDLARQSLNEIVIPDGMSVILRTAGIGRTAEELAWDLENLLTIWTAILNVVLERPSPFLIYRESDSVVRALRDYLTSEIGEILIDDEATYKDAYEFVEQVMPQNLKKLKHYVDPVPLFTRFQIESQIESAFAHTVTLPSGGSIVIDHTEAMVSIDVNSARATKGGDIEATALNINREAAEEVARQLRIRDLGGLIVIDFIDMGPQKHQREVENRLRDAVRQDRARVQIGKISRFGLLEMSRQRLRPSIGESAYQTCPRCSGFGTIRSVESLALAILRIIGEEARKERTSKVIAHLPVEVATYLLNEKRDWVQSLESRNDTQVVLVANSRLETPHYEVRRVRDDQLELTENAGVSYELSHTDAEPETPQAILQRKSIEQPVVGVMKPTTTAPKPQPQQPERKGFWSSLMALFGGDSDATESSGKTAKSNAGGRGRRAQPSRRRGSSGDSRTSSDKRGTPRKKTGKKTAGKKAPTKKAGARKKSAKKAPAKKQVADNKAAQTETNANPESGTETGAEPKRSSRNRRSRGGRRRRRSADKPEQKTDGQQGATEQSAPAAKSGNREAGSAKPETASSPESTPREKPRRARNAKKDSGDSSAPASPPKDTSGSERPAASNAAPATVSAPVTAAKPPPDRAPEAAPQPAAKPSPETAPTPATKPKPLQQKSEPKSERPSPPDAGNGASTKPKSKLLPWEPQPAAELKPPSKSAAPTPAPAPVPKPAAKEPQSPPPPKPAEPSAQD